MRVQHLSSGQQQCLRVETYTARLHIDRLLENMQASDAAALLALASKFSEMAVAANAVAGVRTTPMIAFERAMETLLHECMAITVPEQMVARHYADRLERAPNTAQRIEDCLLYTSPSPRDCS